MAGLVGNIVVEQKVSFRDEKGRFLAECDAAAIASAKQLADAIEQLADATAWSPSKPITAESHGFSATATAFGRTAAIQEFGARAHEIATHLSHGFLAGPDFGPVWSPVHHPGVKARHFLSEAGRAVGSMGVGLIAKNWPS